MAYFKYFSDFLYQSPLKDRTSSFDHVRAKNIFRRAKIREDIFRSTVAFSKYRINANDRPDQIAEKVYGSAQYDWVVLLSNNIINVREEWPLSDREFNRYLDTKYTAAELNDVHHYETTAVYDSSGKLVLPAGKTVDSNFTYQYFDYRDSINTVLETTYTFDSTTTTFDSTSISFDQQEVVQTLLGVTKEVSPVKSISVYEHEIQLNDSKRNIFVLKPRYLQTIIDDFESIMEYDLSSQYVNRTTKKGDELRVLSLR